MPPGLAGAIAASPLASNTADRAVRATLTLALLLLAPVPAESGGQDVELPPGILLLSQIKRHVKQELEHLPEYTCLETVERSGTVPGPRGQMGRLSPLDTLRLEILYTGSKELYASPGAHQFTEEHPGAFVVSGMIGDGIFASHLHTIFVSESALFTWRGEDDVSRDRGWARAVRYDFRVPLSQSGWTVTVPGARGIVAEKGSVWVDPATLDVLRADIHADEIPVQLRVEEIGLVLNYGRMRIGESDIMLPQSAELRMLRLDGEDSVDEFDFTHCRSYQAESTISFDTSEAASKPAAAGAARAARVEKSGTMPGGLVVPITLASALGSDSTVGSLLEGRVTADVDYKGKTLVPAGSPVHGRVRRLEHFREFGGYFAVGLEFTEVETPDAVLRFYADLQTASGAPGLEWVMSSGTTSDTPGNRSVRNTLEGTKSVREVLRTSNLPGVGSFFLRGSKFGLPAGFKMQWKTREFGK